MFFNSPFKGNGIDSAISTRNCVLQFFSDFFGLELTDLDRQRFSKLLKAIKEVSYG